MDTENSPPHKEEQLARYINTIKEDERFLRTLLDTLPVAVFYRDCEGRFLGCNSAFETATGISRKQMTGKTSENLFEGQNVFALVNNDQMLRDQEVLEYQSVFMLHDGDERDVVVRKALFYSADDRVIGSIGSIHDVTEQVRLQELLKNLSIKDDLTDLYNKRGFAELSLQAWTTSLRNRHMVAMLMIDIDYFKLYNDTYGHQKGDDCLVLVANVIKRNTKRHTDVVARFGGEEFVILLPQTDFNGAHIVAKRIRNAIYNLNILHEKGAVNARVTVSIGMAVCEPHPGDEIDSLIMQADEKLYLAKQNGRNRVEGFRN